jgi:hypothetical protein
MTEQELKPISSPLELHRAIVDAAARYPGDPDAAAGYLLSHYALDEAMAQSLRLQGDRQLHGLN